ncbi:MAG: hypothetical protein JO112_06365, partial [Planctomycetes bacterium]|nr:hypothetical protein [Planctomycetota bacterium]
MSGRWPATAGPGCLLVLILVLLNLQASQLPGKGGFEADPAGPQPALEEATPDCEVPPPSPYPGHQREEILHQLGVQPWHAAGFRGAGLKVAILDTGFHGYRAFLGHALPAQVTARSFRPDGNLEARDSQHGILCCEVVHALAP